MARRKDGRFTRLARRAKRAAKKTFNLGRGAQSKGVMGALQHPVSRVVAPAMGTAALLELLFTPIPNGSGGNDSWLQRVLAGYSAFKATGSVDASLLLAQDAQGNNAITILVAQLKQNAVPAAITGGFAALLGWLGRRAGV